MSSGQNLDSELESFRRQWLSDLRSKTDHPAASSSTAGVAPSTRNVAGLFPSTAMSSRRVAAIDDSHNESYLHGPSFDDLPAYHIPGQGSLSHPPAPASSKDKELVSALDHFEEAMLKEAQGKMGDSIKLYRQAYKVLLPIVLP